jgi:uncharacterized protein YjbI with pentapeptide repeats
MVKTPSCCSVFYGIMKDENALFGMVDHYHVEAMAMRWRTCDLWKAAIFITSIFLLLVLWVRTSGTEVRAQEVISRLATPGTVAVQATPTEDATVTALNKEKLAQEVKQLQQNNDRNFTDWLWNFGSTPLTTLTAIAAGLFALVRWFDDRRKEREKQREDLRIEQRKQEKERFESLISVITALQDEKVGERIHAAIMLRMVFLRPGYEQFYSQVFDLAVANLRLRNIDADAPEPLDSLSQALITLFKESFPRARNQHTQDIAQQLDAAHIQLDKAFLAFADLRRAWMPFAHLREANLHQAKLEGANLHQANLSGANLYGAHLNEATLYRANLSKTDLRGAHLCGTQLGSANLRGTDLAGADLRGAILGGINLGHASSLTHTNLCSVKGLTKEQLEACKDRGAIIDEAPTTSPPQSAVVPPPPLSQSNDAQAPSAQGSLPSPDTGGSSATDPKQDSKS